MQTGKSDPRPIVFVDVPRGQFWRPLLRFFDQQLVAQGMVSSEDRAIYQVARSSEEAAQIIFQFYSVYHSLRVVGELLVLRLVRPLSDGAVVQLSREFRDVLRGGMIRQGGPLPQEADEPKLHQFSRLILRFNRKDYGRLTELIHRINALGSA